MTLGRFILHGKDLLSSSGVECADPLHHMEAIAQAALEIAPATLLLRREGPLSQTDKTKIEAILSRRLQGEPLQYILGYAWFWESRLAVGPGVLIPRPETEHLVELALQQVLSARVRVAELGAGSGAIGISLLQERPGWEWYAWENNPQSLPYVKRNLALLPAGAQYHLQAGDYFEGVARSAPYDWIIANPPYVPRAEIPGLSKEVRREPAAALDGGESGLEIVEKMISNASKVLAPEGGVLLEIGSDQGTAVLKLLQGSGWKDAQIEKDLAGLDRIAFAKRSA